jgi:RHH-type transcriptional regulator, rel operon repressor / antitoxin RelB
MMKLMAVRVPEEMHIRLKNLARATNRSTAYYLREALEKHLEELEDAYLAETAYEEFIKSGKQAVSLEEVEKRLGLAD